MTLRSSNSISLYILESIYLFNYSIISMTLYFPLINDVLYARAFM